MAESNGQKSIEDSQKELVASNEECEQLAQAAQSLSDAVNELTPDDVAEAAPAADAAVTSQAPTGSDDVTNAELSESADMPAVPQQQQQQLPPAPVNRNGNCRISADDLEVAEMKVKIVCQEKNNMALRMELKCAELQVAAKEKIDAKKTRLVELLDAKLTNVEKKNAKLLDMMEQVMKDREKHTQRLVDATKNMEELGRRLADSERMKKELARMNGELKEMLTSVEGKGTKLAMLAKEKVLKYKVENERMQKEIDGMKLDAAGQTSSSAASSSAAAAVDDAELVSGGDGKVLWASLETVEELRRQLSGHVEAAAAAAASAEPALAESIRSASGVCTELGAALDQLRQSAVDVVAISSRAVDLDVENGELRRRCEELTQSPAVAAAAAAGQSATAEAGACEARLLDEKDKEIATLTEELQRLKSAIGQLVGLGVVAAK